MHIYILLTLKQIVVRSHAVDAEAPQAARPSEQGAALRATDVASDRMCHDVTESGKVGKTWVLYGVFFWWFGSFLIFPNSWDDDPIWLIFFRAVETIN